MCWISFCCRIPEGKRGFLCRDRPMGYKHITRRFSALKHGIKCVSIPPPWHFGHVCGDRRRPNILGCTLIRIADCIQKETALKKRWGCCAEDETKKLRRGMSDRGSAASGMLEWENNLIPSPPPWAVSMSAWQSCLLQTFQKSSRSLVSSGFLRRTTGCMLPNLHGSQQLGGGSKWRNMWAFWGGISYQTDFFKWFCWWMEVWRAEARPMRNADSGCLREERETKRWPQTVFDTLTSSAHMEFIYQSEQIPFHIGGVFENPGHGKPSSAKFIWDSIPVSHSGEFPEEQLGLVFSALERFARHWERLLMCIWQGKWILCS